MKIAVVFFMLAVSSCSASVSLDVGEKSALICVIEALKTSGTLALNMGILVCTYDKSPDTVKDRQWDLVSNDLEEGLEKVECTIRKVLKLESPVGIDSPLVKDKIKILVPLIRTALEMTGFDATAFGLLCENLKHAFTPDCVPLIMGQKLPQLLINLNTKVCMRLQLIGEGHPESVQGIQKGLTIQELKECLNMLPCIIDETKFAKLKELIHSLLDSEPVSKHPLVADLLEKALCTVVTALLGATAKLTK
ncbi:ranaspumin-like isoform 1-T1 [Leptodactylus fuscus]|uniref:ranaspumin-like isoform X1 n=1 Tax=Leptodactylus fuscus TaxID=238119 RepID=UPI003F4ECF11